MRIKEHLSRKEKEFKHIQQGWFETTKLNEINTPVLHNKIKINSIRDLLSNISSEMMDSIDHNQVEICVDCGEVFQTTFEYKGKVPKCTCCGKVLHTIPKEFIPNFKKWNLSYYR